MLPPDSCSPTPLSCLQGAPDIKDHPVLKFSPQPSYHFNLLSSIRLEGKLPEQSSTCWESKQGPCLKSIVSNGTPIAKSSAELTMEITSLEAEIVHLESYLLSLYRTAFEQYLPSLFENCAIRLQCEIGSKLQSISDQSCQKTMTDMQKGGCEDHGFAGSDNQSHAATSKSSRRGTFNKISRKAYGDEQSQDRKSAADPGRCSLADHLVTSCIDSPPRRLSEDIVRCISSIYCKLADPTLPHTGFSASSTSSMSSNMFSPKNLSDSWSDEAIYHSQLKGVKEETGPYAAMIQVLKICLDDDSFNYATTMLQKFRLLVRRLEKVDPRKMAREGKLAFWINIHNALVMHAHLAYGTHTCVKGHLQCWWAFHRCLCCTKLNFRNPITPFSSVYYQSFLLHWSSEKSKAKKIVSFYPLRISNDLVKWLQTLLSPGKKFKVGSAAHVYSLEYPEPLVHFALCSGAFSDPAVRVYTAENVFQNLKIAREEFIQASVYIHKGTKKIYLPKILYYFAKDTSLTVPGLLDMVGECLSAVEQKEAIKGYMNKDRLDKYIYWLPQSSTFRYVIHGDVVANSRGIFYV